MSAKKKVGPRAQRREAERETKKLMRDRERLAALSPGGAPDRPIEVSSASEVEIAARAAPCIQCGGIVRIDEHLAETIGAMRLRITHVSCPACGTKRVVYFRIGSPLQN